MDNKEMDAPGSCEGDSLRALAALAQPTRLRSFKLLSAKGAEGLVAGDISTALDIPHNTLSTHLTILVQAGLVTSKREGRNRRYFVEAQAYRNMIAFLLSECCGSDKETCLPAAPQA